MRDEIWDMRNEVWDMEIIVLVVAVVALDILALLFGADSRDGVDPNPRLIGFLR